MAMNKTEQKRMADLDHALRLARALRWPDYPEPAPMSGAEINDSKAPGGFKRYLRETQEREMVARGWFVSTYQQGNVTYGCSNGVNHDRDGDSTSTQGMGQMFRTEEEAYRYLRVLKTREYAEHLAKIDAEIERCTR